MIRAVNKAEKTLAYIPSGGRYDKDVNQDISKWTSIYTYSEQNKNE